MHKQCTHIFPKQNIKVQTLVSALSLLMSCLLTVPNYQAGLQESLRWHHWGDFRHWDHTYACIHTHTYVRILSRNIRTHTHSHVRTHASTHTHTHQIHPHAHAPKHTHENTHTNTYTSRHIHRNTHAHAHAHAMHAQISKAEHQSTDARLSPQLISLAC